jgi:hypothetical protein
VYAIGSVRSTFFAETKMPFLVRKSQASNVLALGKNIDRLGTQAGAIS